MLLAAACAAPQGLLPGRQLDLTRPLLVMALVAPGVDVPDRGGPLAATVAAASLRQALEARGLSALGHGPAPPDLALASARERGCGALLVATVTRWSDGTFDLATSPDRLGLSLRVISTADGLDVARAADELEVTSLRGARQSPFDLLPDLARELLARILEGGRAAPGPPAG